MDRLCASYPSTDIGTSGMSVGLPEGQMGNSEVGHLNIGAGRVVYQDLTRISKAIADGDFFTNPVLLDCIARLKGAGGRLHLCGLLSDGGVHSHNSHLYALIELARREGVKEVFVHCILDGRDTPPKSGADYLAQLETEMERIGAGRIATVIGRYYAMDRDGRWDRTQKAFEAVTNAQAPSTKGADAVTEVQRSYDEGVTDEFIEPVALAGRPRLQRDDAAIFFNFRPDRARQLSQLLLEGGFDLTTMTRYRDDFHCPVALGEQDVTETMAQVLAEHELRQLHVAETEKYAHVTYFFNGGREEEWGGETRILVPSPREVGTYDKKPEMSAPEVTRRFVQAIGDGYQFAIVNFANPDMVGHTGVIPAVVRAVETVDGCLGRVVEAVERQGGVSLVTADHGNAEQMLEEDGASPHTAHTANPVPLIVTEENVQLREGGELSDLVPTALELLGVEPPPEMTGRTLLRRVVRA
jgi:2,3-bisphosphoglycerate-independent phosphoglycerate mutase